ncbi:MAG: hypothetical protein K5761_07795 [Clostridiales bacterium]|nr:hypothetical protein [Clostridiales bacterium]
MKKVLSVISLLLVLSLLLSSCTVKSSEKALDKAVSYLDNKQYNECREYLLSLDKETLNEIYEPVLDKITEIYEAQKTPDNKTDISEVPPSLTVLCRSLFGIVKVLPRNALNNNEDIKNICYFSYLDDLMRYREIYSMLKDMNSHSFFSSIANALNKYDEEKDYSYFYEAYNIISSYSSSQFDRNKFQVTECKQLIEQLKTDIKNAINALETKNIKNIVIAIDDVYDDMDSLTLYINIAKAVQKKTAEIFNTARNNISAHESIDTAIEYSESSYSYDTLNVINGIFGINDDSSSADSESGNMRDITSDISKEGLVNQIKNALTSTKEFTGTVLVQYKTENKIVFLNYDDSLLMDKEKPLSREDIEEFVSAYTKPAAEKITFKLGKYDDKILSDYIPPAYDDFQLDSKLIKDYSIMQGKSGYLITVTVDSVKTVSSRSTASIKNIVNPFGFETDAMIDSYTTYYKPTTISYVINNNNRLTGIEYTLKGTNTSKFSDGADFVTCDFTFESYNKFIYTY